MKEAAIASPQWFAVSTTPRHEKAVFSFLHCIDVEAYLPTQTTERLWRNRTRNVVSLPLFPTYLFVRMCVHERGRVLRIPGVKRILGTFREPSPITDAEIEALRTMETVAPVEPLRVPFTIGQKVRVIGGAMTGIEGFLVRQSKSFRFVLSLSLINNHAAVEVDASVLEAVEAQETKGASPLCIPAAAITSCVGVASEPARFLPDRAHCL